MIKHTAKRIDSFTVEYRGLTIEKDNAVSPGYVGHYVIHGYPYPNGQKRRYTTPTLQCAKYSVDAALDGNAA